MYNKSKTADAAARKMQQPSLRQSVLISIMGYFDTIPGADPNKLKALILEEVESAMYEAAMKQTKGNQVKAAKVLGISRGTLRSKLNQYFDTTLVGGMYHSWQYKPAK